jgi:hypothetical protein
VYLLRNEGARERERERERKREKKREGERREREGGERGGEKEGEREGESERGGEREGEEEREPLTQQKISPFYQVRSDVVSFGLNGCPNSPLAVPTRPDQLPNASFMIF